MKFVLSIVVLILALLVGLVVRSSQSNNNSQKKWHDGPEWERLFRVYDTIAKEQYNNCGSKLIQSSILTAEDKKSRYTTQVHICGDSSHSPVMFFHGAATNSLMYGDWLIPELLQAHQTIVVDYPCDMGRSYIADGNTTNCPQTVTELQDWAMDLIEELHLSDQKVSLVGYSYGSFVASQIAIKYPQSVDKLVLFAPAAVFAPIAREFLFRAITFGLVYKLLPTPSMKDWIRGWFFNWMMAGDATLNWSDGNDKELRVASDEAGPAILPVEPIALDVDTLTKMNQANPTLLILGEEEVVIDVDTAIKAAKAANIKVQQYSNSGHMLVAEYPRQEVISVVSSFLK